MGGAPGQTGGFGHGHHKEEKEHVTIELQSPTSISMKNSYIIKNADPSFEAYYNSMKKKRQHGGTHGYNGLGH